MLYEQGEKSFSIQNWQLLLETKSREVDCYTFTFQDQVSATTSKIKFGQNWQTAMQRINQPFLY